jgi:hypothetical protein
VKHGTLQRAPADAKNESTVLQPRAWDSGTAGFVPPIVKDVVRSPGQPLDAGARAYFEPRFGHSFGSVRVHADEQAAQSARAVNALAYTVGDHIAFDTGRYSPTSHADGKRLLAHELTHIAQQSGQAPSHVDRGGMTKPGDACEVEADKLAKAYTSDGRGDESSPQAGLANALLRALSPAAAAPQSVSRACACGGGSNGCTCPHTEDVGTRSLVAGPGVSSSGKQAAMDLASLIISKNPSDEVPTGDEVLSQAPAPAPAPAAAPAPAPVPAAPEQKCTVTSGPSYSPSGSIPVTAAGGRKSASFDFSAFFGEAHGAAQRLGLGLRTGLTTGAGIGAFFLGVGALPGALLGAIIGGIAGLAGSDSAPKCCEVRQFLKWDATAAAALGGVPHGGFPTATPADTWIEDRDSAGTRYGHRSGPFSALAAGDQYTTNGVPDAANGNEYRGHDGPAGPTAKMQGEWQFQLKVVDTCHGDAEKASSSVITVKWS